MAFTAGAALAEPSPQQVKKAAEQFDLGVKSAQAGDLEAAAVHFENADREAPSDATLRAAIRARKDAKQLARAATLAELALVRHPDKPDLKAFAEGVLSATKGLHKVVVSCKPACELVVDKRLVHGEASTKVALYLDPGKRVVVAGWGDRSVAKDVTAAADGSSALSFTPPEAAPKPAATSEPVVAPAASAPEPRSTPASAGRIGSRSVLPTRRSSATR